MSEVVAIQELARQVRRGTIELLSAAKPHWLHWAPEGTSNHLLWHAGHALWLQDILCLEPLKGLSELPPDWSEMFGMNCRPVAETTHWPDRRQVLQLLTEQLSRIITALAAAEGRLRDDSNARSDTLASRIIHGLHDEARHQGEMYLLVKLCRARETTLR